MNKRNIEGRKHIFTEISRTRNVFTELDDFFLKADVDIADDPDDQREGIGRLPGLDRLMPSRKYWARSAENWRIYVCYRMPGKDC